MGKAISFDCDAVKVGRDIYGNPTLSFKVVTDKDIDPRELDILVISENCVIVDSGYYYFKHMGQLYKADICKVLYKSLENNDDIYLVDRSNIEKSDNSLIAMLLNM